MTMKKILTIAVLGLLVGMAAEAQPKTKLLPNETVLLYADEFTDMTDPVRAKKITAAGFEMAVDNEITEGEAITAGGNLTQIGKDARFDLYFPKKPNGLMVVVCPGGGYSMVSSYWEGLYVAEWMLERGITVAVAKYRMPNRHKTVPVDDIQNVFRYCRAHAEEWGVSSIGVMGFSAGGYLAVSASVFYDDEITRPDFSVFVYPVVTMDTFTLRSETRMNTIGTKAESEERHGKSWEEWDKGKKEYAALEEQYSLDKQVSSDCPPAFIALSNDDSDVNPENSIRLYRALRANGVPVELHVYTYGDHGWGFSSKKYGNNDRLGACREDFYAALERWLMGIPKSKETEK